MRLCRVAACARGVYARELCAAHYTRDQRSTRGLRPEDPIGSSNAVMTDRCARCGAGIAVQVRPARCESCYAEITAEVERYAKAATLIILAEMVQEAVA